MSSDTAQPPTKSGSGRIYGPVLSSDVPPPQMVWSGCFRLVLGLLFGLGFRLGSGWLGEVSLWQAVVGLRLFEAF